MSFKNSSNLEKSGGGGGHHTDTPMQSIKHRLRVKMTATVQRLSIRLQQYKDFQCDCYSTTTSNATVTVQRPLKKTQYLINRTIQARIHTFGPVLTVIALLSLIRESSKRHLQENFNQPLGCPLPSCFESGANSARCTVSNPVCLEVLRI